MLKCACCNRRIINMRPHHKVYQLAVYVDSKSRTLHFHQACYYKLLMKFIWPKKIIRPEITLTPKEYQIIHDSQTTTEARP